MWQHTRDDGSVEYIGAPRTVIHAEVQHSADIFNKWSVGELAAIGIVAMQSAAPVALSSSAEDVEVRSVPTGAVIDPALAQSAPAMSAIAAIPALVDTVAREEVAALVARLDQLQQALDAAKAAKAAPVEVAPVAPATQPPTIIETREEIDPSKLRAMVMLLLEEQNEAVAYKPGDDESLYPLLSKRASQSGVTVAQAASTVIDEIAAIKR